MNGQFKAYNKFISDIGTELNEALYIIVLDNSTADHTKYHNIEKKVSKQEASSGYIQVKGMHPRFKYWYREGMPLPFEVILYPRFFYPSQTLV